MQDHCDIAIIGAGAAGLMAAISAGRAARQSGVRTRIVALDGAKKVGAKILVAGGGRCNVTHHAVDESAYAGSTRPAIRKVLGRLTVEQTVAFFAELGVELKREETGKLFPTTDNAHTVLDALLRAAADAGAELWHPSRVLTITRDGDGFAIEHGSADAGASRRVLFARQVILATGGLALPKSGSDGAGYHFAKTLGHTMTRRVFPALVPLLLTDGHAFRELSGIAFAAELSVMSGAGKRLASFTNSTLCTHFGLSGPGPLDVSRYYFDALANDPEAKLLCSCLPGVKPEAFDAQLQAAAKQPVARVLANAFASATKSPMPDRLVKTICDLAGVAPTLTTDKLTRDARRSLVTAATALPLPVTGSRGFTYAEVTAGGAPLAELHLDTLASRCTPGLYIIGELCDVDGRIGGFNFQWAWASGYVAGRAAMANLGPSASE